MDEQDELIPVFVPALAVVLIHSEDQKGEPLTFDEVIRIRDSAHCIMMKVGDAKKVNQTRGWTIDPENCWHEWQLLRRELGRKPDLDPGPRFDQVRSSDPEYQQTIRDAQSTLDTFRKLLPHHGYPNSTAAVKTTIYSNQQQAFMWLNQVRQIETGFVAKFFEVPAGFTEFSLGDELTIDSGAVLDWMVNDNGVVHGGFSLRYQRSKLPHDEQASFDEYVGATKYV